MGSLALWGAVAGGAKATKERLVREQEAELRQEEKDMDTAREERLLKLRQKYGETQQERGFKHEREMFGVKTEAEKAAEERGYGFKREEAEKERTFKAEQQEKKLAAEKDLATMKAGSADGGTRYQSVKVKTSSMTPEGGFEEKEQPIVFDKQTGEHFIKTGDRMVPYQLRENLNEIEGRLYDNPGALQYYLQTPYGKKHGVPKWYEVMYGDKPQ